MKQLALRFRMLAVAALSLGVALGGSLSAIGCAGRA
jgi:hypothetical protein